VEHPPEHIAYALPRLLIVSGAPARFLKRVGKNGIGATAALFFYFAPPTFEFAHPEFSVLGGQTRIVAHPNY